MFFWVLFFAGPTIPTLFMPDLIHVMGPVTLAAGIVGLLAYFVRTRTRIIDDIVVNMVDVGEETGELDTMLYKVADNNEEEVKVMTEGLVSILEPLLIVFLGVAVGFIVVALFLPLITLITQLSS